jgi:hypothetical protein
VWHCEASFLANLWQLATHRAETAHAGPRTEVWEVEGTTGYGAGLVRLLANHGLWVVELDSTQRQTRRHGAMSIRWMRGSRRIGLWGGFQSTILSASTVRSRAGL